MKTSGITRGVTRKTVTPMNQQPVTQNKPLTINKVFVPNKVLTPYKIMSPHKILNPMKGHPSQSVIQVDDDIHMLLDSNDLVFSAAKPADRSVELCHKTYSKKTPIVFHQQFVSQTMTSINGGLANDKAQPSTSMNGSSSFSGNKTWVRKRKTDSNPTDSKEIVSKKIPKKNVALRYKSPQSFTVNGPKQPRRAVSSTLIKYESSSDSDVEILAVKLFNSPAIVPEKASDYVKKGTNVLNGQGTKRSTNTFMPPELHNEVLLNDTSTAPFISTNPNMFPDVGNRTNSMRWLSANGTISVPVFKSKGFVRNGETSTNEKSENGIFLPEMKLPQEKKPKGKRELKGLYENLNEIAWAQEKSFKNLLSNPDYIRHSDRSTSKVADTGKKLRKREPNVAAKHVQKKSAANLLAQKKSKLARLTHKYKAQSSASGKNIPKVTTAASNRRKAKQLISRKKINEKHIKKLDILKNCSSNEDDVRYQLNPEKEFEPLKTKSNMTKTKLVAPKVKFDLPNLKAGVLKTKSADLKLKHEALNPKYNGMKFKPDPQKVRANVLKVKSDDSKLQPKPDKLKVDISKLKPYLPQIKPEDSPPSTSGLQNGTYKNRSSLNSKQFSKTSDMKSILKNMDIAKEMQHFRKLFNDDDDDLYSCALKKGSKLRVLVEPLESTKLWTPECYEEFRRRILDQALCKALEKRDLDSITEMYQELLESFMSSQNSTGNNRTLKKKKAEEEGLRSSARQSEGAFRYKEIVVKKHPNYMQVVLVPNDVRQNSLTVEAMKELKDAFLLAKKDPNCRAVLLNSSGPYFCTGIDLSPLVGSNKKQAAEEISHCIGDLVMTLGMFTKPIVAAVNGAAMGFGVSLLTYCDVVLASDKATFCLPAAKIGYIPEGGVTLTLPQVVGSSVASEMFLQGRRLTAEQAFRCGLVSEVLWPTRLMNEVIPRLKIIISQPLQAMEATKTMVRCHLWDKLKSHVERERRLLCEHWLGAQCQTNIKTLLQTGWLAD